jgi:hypothetical protein
MASTSTDPPVEIVLVQEEETGQRPERLPSQEDPTAAKAGRWYWVIDEIKRRAKFYTVSVLVDDDEDEDLPEVSENDEEEEPENDNPVALSTKTEPPRWFGCVTHVGSNYVELKGPFGKTVRVHDNDFDKLCTFEPEPDRVIHENVGKQQAEVRGLMGKVRDITARLAVTNGPALPAGAEAGALAVYEGKSMDEYKTSLVLAQEKTLPALFEEIKAANGRLGRWLAAPTIPMQAEADAMTPVLGKIKDRIFSVELYAGLVEKVEQVADGEPAEAIDRVHLFQRRHYMDEECLANYSHGGMDFKSLGEFDRWLAKPVNLNRILPYARSIAAFRIRRHRKDREMIDISDYFRIQDEQQKDERTFLYIRNGEQLFRLNTKIRFGAKLFPDVGKQKLEGKLMAKVWGDQVQDVITENEWKGMREHETAELRKRDEMRAHLETLEGEERRMYAWKIPNYIQEESNDYEPFNRENIYYDDILKYLQDEMNKHNRLVLVLQGLLDRSPCLHPHPPWQLWDTGSFAQALELVYDSSRTLVAGEAPNYKAFRDQLNARLKPGDITVGQEVAWEIVEAAKESERLDRDYRTRQSYRPKRFRPYGNPGPGALAHVVKVNHKDGTATFQWVRDRQKGGGKTGTTFTTPLKNLLNVSAYQMGDFRQFFADPRTRADYLQWAPFLLEAEEYWAGNRKAREPEKMPEPKKRSLGGSYEYQKRKRRLALVGKAIRLKRDVTRGDGVKYPKGSLFRVTSHYRAEYTIQGCNEDGTREPTDKNRRYVSGMQMWDLEVDPSIPPDAQMEADRLAEQAKEKARAAKEKAAGERKDDEGPFYAEDEDDED